MTLSYAAITRLGEQGARPTAANLPSRCKGVNPHHEATRLYADISMSWRADRRGNPAPNDRLGCCG